MGRAQAARAFDLDFEFFQQFDGIFGRKAKTFVAMGAADNGSSDFWHAATHSMIRE